jgi:type I restriction enzyme S subunit
MFGDPNRNERKWPTLSLDEAFDDVSRQGNKIPRSEYLTAGKIPVIDQGQDEIAGYWDEVGDAYRGKLPVILFGDHTRIFKLLEYPFCIGADGVRLLRPKTMDSHFAFGLLTLLDVPSRGYSRHFKELRALSYINPPPDRQERFGKAFAELRKQSAKATTSAATLETLFQTLLHRAFDGSLTAKWREGQGKELLQEMENHSKR